VDDERIAREYARRGGTVYRVEVTRLASVEVEVTQARRAVTDYPGDTAAERAALTAAGYDVAEYDDETENGRQHRTYRLLTDAAVAACAIVDADE
jgi:hypothetical protein